MTRHLIWKFVASILTVLILATSTASLYYAHNFSSHFFRLSQQQISDTLTSSSTCSTIATCDLQPGDILIRRYITSRTWIVNTLFHPYFTHTALYLGNDRIIEAVGKERNRQDDIQESSLSHSDWLNSDIPSWVIMRPKHITEHLETLVSNLQMIANDPAYVFGLPRPGGKQTTCADLIFQQLLQLGLIRPTNTPEIVTPDYLFWITTTNPQDFEIVGYSITR